MMKKMFKKFMAVATAVAMTASMSVAAFAATPVDNEITVPVKVVIKDEIPADKVPDSYHGPITADSVLFDNDITIPVDKGVSVMDFIMATGLNIDKTSSGGSEYIQKVDGLGTIDLEYTDHYYKGYSWMIQLQAGDEVTETGTRPSWAEEAPEANAFFASTLAANNVTLNGDQYFLYDYSNPEAGGFTTSVEGIVLEYDLTSTSW